MSLTTRVVLAVLLPAIFAGIGALASAGAEKKGLRPRAALFQGLGLVIGLAAAQWAVSGWPPFLPADVTLSFPSLGLLALLAGTVQASGSRLAWPSSALVGIIGFGFLLGPMLRNSWGWGRSPMQGAMLVAGPVFVLCFVAVLLLVWRGLAKVSQRESDRGPVTPLLLTILAGLSAGALVISHTAFLSQLAGALAAGLFVLAGVSFWDRRASLNPGGVAVLVVTLGGLWICGYFYASLPPESLAMLALSLFSLGLRWPSGPTAPGWKSWLLRGALLIVLAGAALYRAYSLNAGDLDYDEF